MADNVLGTLFGEIANSIRSKTGGTGTMKPAEFPEQIDSITASNVIDNVEIALDFSNGDLTERLPEGYSANAVTIFKPDTLIPENIAKDVEIAGIVGTHEGGSGGSVEGMATVTFCNYNGSVLYSRLIFIGDTCADPISQGQMNTPTRASDVQYNYTFSGWSETQGGTASSTALKNITADKTVYAAYSTSLVYYTARFFDGDTLRETLTVAYGEKAQPSTDKPEHKFVTWTPSDLTIYGDTDFYGTWNETEELEYASWAKIAERAADGTAANYWNIGDTKTIPLTWADGTTETVTAQLVGYNHDTAEDGSIIPMSFITTDLISKTVQFHTSSYRIPWTKSSMCTWFNNDLFNALPVDLQAVIKTAAKKSFYWKQNTDDGAITETGYHKCWCPAAYEICNDPYYIMPKEEGSVYSQFENTSYKKAYRKLNGVNTEYWLRSTHSQYSASLSALYHTGSSVSYTSTLTSYKNVPLGFCI